MIRVSDVLAVLFPDSLRWVPQDCLDAGSRMHLYVEMALNNIQAGFPTPVPDSLSDRAGEMEYYRAMKVVGWVLEQGFSAWETEPEYCDPAFQYEGHPDFVGNKILRKLTLDWKFTESILLQNYVQAEVYRHLTKNPVWLVQCNQGATIKIHRLKPRPDLWAVFLSGLNVLKFQIANEPSRPVVRLTDEEIVTTAAEIMRGI